MVTQRQADICSNRAHTHSATRGRASTHSSVYHTLSILKSKPLHRLDVVRRNFPVNISNSQIKCHTNTVALQMHLTVHIIMKQSDLSGKLRVQVFVRAKGLKDVMELDGFRSERKH